MALLYKVKLMKGDYSFEAEGDKTFVLDMLARYWTDSEAPAMTPPRVSPKQKLQQIPPVNLSAGKKLSVGEFIRQLGLKKHTDMVLAFGYYLEKMSGLASFTPADVNACYYDAKLESSNTSQMIIQNIKGGRMMSAKKGVGKDKKAYVLTRTGEEFIEKQPAKLAK